MRVLITNADVDSKRLSKLAKALKKHWPLAPMTLMQSQNLLATVLGYRDLHDLQAHLLKYISPADFPNLSRSTIKDSLCWELFRKHSLGFDQAHKLVNALPLKVLDIDAHTSEAGQEARDKEMAAKGILMIMDEYHHYMAGTGWFERTPELQRAGAPAHEFVLLPNGKAIRWSRIKTLVDRLPEDLVSRLRTEGRYKAIKGDNEVLVAFYRDELLPEVPEPARVAIEEAKELPLGFELKLYGFDKKGLVLNNTHLGGVLPVVYSNHSRRIFDAAALLMQGLPVELEDNTYIVGSDHVWEMPGSDPRSVSEDWRAVSFLTSSFASPKAGIAKTFTERGQQYLRTYDWLDMDDVPGIIKNWYDMTNPVHEPASELAVPVWHREFHDRTWQLLSDHSKRASECINDAMDDGRLLALVNRYATQLSPEYLDYLPKITRMHTSQPEPDWEMSQEQMDEEQVELAQALAHYNELGAEIVQALPALGHLGTLALGWLWYSHHDEYYESHDAYMVPWFDANKRSEIRAYLSFLAFHYCSQRLSTSVSNHSNHGDSDAMRIAIDLVLAGKRHEDELNLTFYSLTYFIDSVKRQHEHLSKVLSWREKMKEVDQVRASGKFLYARGKISAVKEEPWLLSTMREGRKYGFKTIEATQQLGELSGLAQLFAQARSLSIAPSPESMLIKLEQISEDTNPSNEITEVS
jgi:hypothetical protein